MTGNAVNLEISDSGVATVRLNRPDIHNAFDDLLITNLTATFARLRDDDGVRCVVLAASGKSFSAGADLNWMKRVVTYDPVENLADAKALARLLNDIAVLPKPVVAAVQGAAYGGGVGLVAACDIAIASDAASFSLSEVKLGLIPATISPFVLRAIGERQAGRYFLSAEQFSASEALRIGLVHEVVAAVDLDEAVGSMSARLLKNSPKAMAAAKRLLTDIAHRSIDGNLLDETAQAIADIRKTDEGHEGVVAFLEKRKPSWVDD